MKIPCTALALGLLSMMLSCAYVEEASMTSSAALAGDVLLVPTRDVERVGIAADGDATNLYRNVDDGTSFAAADDGATTVRNSWSVSSAAYTAAYSGPQTDLANLTVSFRALASSGVVGSARVELYDGETRVASGPDHALTASWTNYAESFPGVTISSASNLRTKIVLTRPGTAGYLRCTQLFVRASGTPAPAPAKDAGTPVVVDSGAPISGALVTDPSLVLAVPTIAKPGYLTPIRPPPFGASIVRIVGDPGASVLSGKWSSDARHHYSKDQPWSADGSMIALQNKDTGGAIYLDGRTYSPLRAKCSNYSVGDDRWHPSPLHPHERINVRGASLSWFDVTACTTTRSWTLPFAVAYFGSGEGNASNDGRFVVLGDASRMFVVDMEAYPARRVGPAVPLSECGLPSCSVDWVSVSASGRYAIVSYEGDHLRIFDVDPATLALRPHTFTGNTLCNGTREKGFIYDLGHADVALDPYDGGEDVIVGQEHCGRVGQTVDGRPMGHVAKVRLRDGRVTALTSPTNEAYAHHVSTRSLDRPGWAYVGYYPQPGKRFDDEIVAVKLDGSGTVERWAHKHSVFSGCYRCESHAVPSRDGLRVLFASNWAATCGSACGAPTNAQAYVVDPR